MRRMVLLPGLDGTGALFDDFVCAAPATVRPEVVPLPREPFGYVELVEHLAPQLRLTTDTILLAESFSGPLAVLLAQRHEIAALVLCNSFVTPPRARALAALTLSPLFHLPLPAAVIRWFLVGANAPDALVARIRAAVASVPPAVLAARMASVLRVDVSDALARCSSPIVYLRGSEDRLVPEASANAVVKAASAPVSLVRIPGPHLLLQAAPRAAWRAIEDAVLEPRAAVTADLLE